MQQSESQDQNMDLNINQLIIRRADLDDSDVVEEFTSEDRRAVFNNPSILSLIETSSLSITALSPQGDIVALAVFSDQHIKCNDWEEWIEQSTSMNDFNSLNTIWLTFFSTNLPYMNEAAILVKILQSAYASEPFIKGILCMVNGAADTQQVKNGFGAISELFQEIEIVSRDQLKKFEHYESCLFYSPRRIVIPPVEIRRAQQEDHDDLVQVFNKYSTVVTETYGEYFIAELIAAQNNENKALVAQVEAKAVGMVAVTSEVDTNLLYQSFELDIYDNLLKEDYMELVRQKWEEIKEKRRIEEMERQKQEILHLKQQIMICNILAQRAALQQFLIKKEQEILEELKGYILNEEDAARFDRKAVVDIINRWLKEFVITQPSEYFVEKNIDDPTIFSNILTKDEFLIKTLEFFYLPEGYMEGEGHFKDWVKKKEEEEKKQKNKNKNIAKYKAQRAAKKRGAVAAEVDKWEAPSYFDLEPLLKSLELFFQAKPDARSMIRTAFNQFPEKVKNLFKNEKGEISETDMRLNTTNLEKHMENAGLNFSDFGKAVGPMLRCFGDLQVQPKVIVTPPPMVEQEEEKKQKRVRGQRGGRAQKKEEEVQVTQIIECGVEIEFLKDKNQVLQPVKTTLLKTSFNALNRAMEIMQDYDYTLQQLNFISSEKIADELVAMQEPEKQEEHEEQNEQLSPGKESQHSASSPWKVTPGQTQRASVAQAQEKGESIQDRGSEVEDLEEFQQAERQSQRSSLIKTGRGGEQEPTYEETIASLDDPNSIPQPPNRAKNGFCVTLFCMDETYESRVLDFIPHIFDLFPERDYLVLTQPHTVPETSIHQYMQIVPKKTSNTFKHVLYIMHRDSIWISKLKIRRSDLQDIEEYQDTLQTIENGQNIINAITESEQENSLLQSFTATIEGNIIGIFVISRDVNLKYYRSHFHIEDFMLLEQHRRSGHTKLLYCVVEPIFIKYQRLMLKEVMRLANKTCVYFEINDMNTIIPPIFNDLYLVRNRRFPAFLRKKWNHQRNVAIEEPDNSEFMLDQERDFMDQEESTFCLAFISKKLISEPLIVNNTRIVVVGASDCGISFVETLLSTRYVQFTNIFLINPEGIHIEHENLSLKSYSTSYPREELQRLMLENRIHVIDARMVAFNREEKSIHLHDESEIKYDLLILCMGLQENTLNEYGIVSRGVAPVPENKKHIEGVLSIDDPKLYSHFRAEGTLMALLTHKKHPGNVIIYGHTLNCYTFIQGMLSRGIQPKKIYLIYHEPEYDELEDFQQFGGDENIINNSKSFQNDQQVEETEHLMLQSMGVNILTGKVKDIIADEKNILSKIILQIGESEEEIKEISCRVLVTCGKVEVNEDVFSAIHNNGLVYNGRLIIDRNFQTTDTSIFAAGSLCEFSKRYKYKSQGRCLRMDRYNGREIGLKLARSVLELQDPMLQSSSISLSRSKEEEDLPVLYMPRGKGGKLPCGFYYFQVQAAQLSNPLKIQQEEVVNREEIISNTLQKKVNESGEEKWEGHYIRFRINPYGLVEQISYFSTQSIVIQSLWSFVGLSETYLNKLWSRFESNLIPDVALFLQENWAMALYHDWFADFCLRLKADLRQMPDIQIIMQQIENITANGQGVTREQVEKLCQAVSQETKKMIEDQTMEYLKVNTNHLPMYYIPGVEFPWAIMT